MVGSGSSGSKPSPSVLYLDSDATARRRVRRALASNDAHDWSITVEESDAGGLRLAVSLETPPVRAD